MSELQDFRLQKDDYFRSGHDSPLTEQQRASFSGLAYFPESEALRFVVAPDLLPDPEPVDIDLSRGDAAAFVRWARVSFEVDGEPAQLSIFRDASGNLFLPFRDATSATGETYPAGRYLEPAELEDGSLLLDFNYAYNPYCAYNDNWTCPLTPPENTLRVAIRAGEKASLLHSD